MDLFKTLKELLLYAGVDKAEFDALTANIREENLVLLKMFSQIAGIFFSCCPL